MENNEIWKVCIKNRNEKSHENIFVYDISYRTLIGPKPFHIRFDKIDGFIRIYDGNRYVTLIDTENMMLFTTELDILQV